jgi:transcriptional regulator with XRE-family HTH domain/tetratricopeptide (TPR) repeat protein
VNVDASPPGLRVDPGVWQQPQMRRSLAERDLAGVFRLLRRVGISQRAVAAATGMSPSEVYEVLHGRKVMAYDVLCRIADGLGVPRGRLGLAYDGDTQALLAADQDGDWGGDGDPVRDEREQVRALLAHAAEVTVGVSDSEVDPRWVAEIDGPTPTPNRIGRSDIEQIEAVTAALRAMDYQYGGGTCREAILAQARWVSHLLAVPAEDEVRHRLHVTLADLHNLAGWTSFDVGHYSAARSHFARALTQAREAGNPSLIANVLYRTGRLHLHRGMITEALRFYQLGQIAAQDSGCTLTVAVLCANEAWAYGMLGDRSQAEASLHRAGDELARAEATTAAPWVRFFTAADLDALTGMAYLELTGRDPACIPPARDALTRAVAARGPDMTRSRTFELSALGTVLLRDGEEADGIRAGWQAADLAEQVRSVRVRDRLRPLAKQAATAASSDAADLAHHLQALCAPSLP